MTHGKASNAWIGLLDWVRSRPWIRRAYSRVPAPWRRWAVDRALAPSLVAHRFTPTAAWTRADTAPDTLDMPPADAGTRGPGINLLGFMRGEFGIAESARSYSRALVQGGFKVAINDVNLGLGHRWNHRGMDRWITTGSPYATTIAFVNPDHLAEALALRDPRTVAGERVVACCFWELETVPAAWLPVLEGVDAIMVASGFVEAAFRKATDKPVFRVPLPLFPDAADGLQREDFGIEAGKFVFLCSFDFHSSVERKNPLGAIAAFKAAFPASRDDVRLLVKTSGGDRAPEQLARLAAAVAGDPRIALRDQVLAHGHMRALQRCCDAYVSLHRAEGFGLGMAECMALGKPVIATGWSGNVDFMDDDNSLLVDYALVPVPAGQYPHSAGCRWAEPDIGSAARAMARLVDEPGLAGVLGAKAAGVLAALSPVAVAEAIGAWLERLPMPADAVRA